MLHYAISKAMREQSPTPLSVLYKSFPTLQNSLEVIPLFHFNAKDFSKKYLDDLKKELFLPGDIPPQAQYRVITIIL